MKVYNTLSHSIEEFVPLAGKKVMMYVCGITPYDFSHLGHARAYVAFDIVRRYLKLRGYDVKYVQNFTDIDDKIINKAIKDVEPKARQTVGSSQLEGGPMKAREIAEKFISTYFEDAGKLRIMKADVYPRVTEHIPEIVALVKKLLAKGVAYEIDGDVYYSVETFPGYGKLSKQKMDQIKAGARVEVDERKKHPADFALWKKAKEGEPYWESPWGKGRPGWHIECSVMSMKYLGETLDIHGGGADLIFPHHENEIAQSEGATGKKFVNYWMHNGFVTVNKEKMSKSLGNFFTIREILAKYPPEAVRFFLLSTQYRQPIDFSDAQLTQAKNTLETLQNCVSRLQEKKAGNALDEELKLAQKKFYDAMDNDFNTPEALAAVFEVVGKANQAMEKGKKLDGYLALLLEFDKVFDVLKKEEKIGKEFAAEVEKLVAEREKARKEKNWAKADEVRKKLMEIGVVLEDTKEGARWRKAN